MDKDLAAVIVRCATLLVILLLVLLLCFTSADASAESLFADGFELAQVDPCDDGNNRVAPAVLAGNDRSWQSAWSSTNGNFPASFPNSPPAPIALGANVGQYLSVGYIYPAGLVWQITFDQAQPNNGYGYGQPRPANGGMFIGFSPCRGDLRPTDPQSEYWWLRPACRTLNTAGTLTLTTRTDLPAHICHVPAGVVWYMTVAPVNPNSPDFPADTCEPPTFSPLGLGCDVQASHRGL